MLAALRAELATAMHERLHLVALECRHASLQATHMVLLATVAALMLCSAWATLMVGLYMACTTQGVSWQVALLLVLLLNLAGALACWLWVFAMSKALTFPITRRMLRTWPWAAQAPASGRAAASANAAASTPSQP